MIDNLASQFTLKEYLGEMHPSLTLNVSTYRRLADAIAGVLVRLQGYRFTYEEKAMYLKEHRDIIEACINHLHIW